MNKITKFVGIMFFGSFAIGGTFYYIRALVDYVT